ncbi:MAG: hypothetical protein EP329_21175 [Deltaproteobacteria bacterium]|nr:MAG: hypothetical protein EP329_21175 [Deltaproteobacteria bacterium]
MTRWILAALLVALTAGPALAAEPPCTNTNVDARDFVIKRGKHDARPKGVRKLQLRKSFSRTLHFQIRFDSSVRYATADPQNQHDWNKVMGFTTYLIHKNSIRLGWRYNPTTDLVELGYYGYLARQRGSKLLDAIPIGAWADVELGMDTERMYVTVNGVTHEQSGDMDLSSWLPIGTVALVTAYFGGDEKAPQAIRVEVRGIVVDDSCER